MGQIPEDPGLVPGRDDLYASPPPQMAALRDVVRMAGPMIVGTASGTVMHFVDFWMVSQVGTSAMAAIHPAGMWVFVMVSFLIGTVSCTNTFVGQSFGAGRYGECAKYAWQGVYIALLAGSVALVLWFCAPPIFRLSGHGPEVQAYEVVYFRLRLFSISAMGMSVAMSTFFQGIGRPRVSMTAAIIANALNALLDWLLIFGNWGFPRMEVAGAAIATVIAAFVNAAILLMVFLSPRYNGQFKSRAARALDRHRMGRLFHIGWPAGLTFALDVASWSVFTSFIIGRLFGDVALAASNVAMQIMHLSFMPTIGLSIAVTALVGQYIGNKDIPGAKHRAYVAVKLGIVYMFVMGVSFFVFREELVGLFCKLDDPLRPEIMRIGTRVLMVAAVFQAFDAIGIVMSSALKGVGDTRWVAACMVIFTWAVFLPLSLLFGHVLKLGAPGAWVGGAVYICILAMVLLWRFQSERWRKINIFGAAPTPVP